MTTPFTVPLANVSLEGLAGGAGVSWWQTVGGLAAVFGLLLLSLRLLGRFQKHRGGDRAAVLTIWPLGPKREIQVLRLGDAVHYVYRHDGAMVVLERETLADWEAKSAVPGGGDATPRTGVLPDLTRLKAMVARVGAPTH